MSLRFLTLIINKTALLCLAVLLLLSISCKREKTSFVVNVKNQGLEYPVRLLQLDTTGLKHVDSLMKPAEGTFKFLVQSDNAYAYFIQSGNKQIGFMAGPGDMLEVDFSSEKVDISENEKYNDLREFLNNKQALEKKADSLAVVFNSAQLTDSFPQVRERLNEEFNSLIIKSRMLFEEYITKEKSPAIFMALTSRLRQSVVLNYAINPQIFHFADSVLMLNYPQHPYTIWLNNFVATNKVRYGNLQISTLGVKKGDVFPEVQLPGLNNKKLSINPAKGEIALIYLWNESTASRRATSAIKLLNDKYKDQGLRIYAIGFMQKKSDWASLIELDKMWWNNMIDEQGPGSSLISKLHINRLPYFIILDDKRKVLANYGSVAELNEWARTHFSR